MKYFFILFFMPAVAAAQYNSGITQWKQQASRVKIYRDNYGVPHIYGKTDADAVFGLMYAQCEDDFKRVEMNYIEKLGRKAELFGQKELYNDLYIRMILDSNEAKADFVKAPAWLKKLMIAWADGINYYLYEHPNLKPSLIKRFEPWYPLLWTDGSIGAISTGSITPLEVEALYAKQAMAAWPEINRIEQLSGSNGFAIAPSRSASGNALLYINPHVTFYFRPEVHMVSEEGLNVYGAVTWGQFFIYQGFNEHCGWMHTSSDVDVSDMYAETIVNSAKGKQYRYNNQWRKVADKKIRIGVSVNNQLIQKDFVVSSTHHGPIMARIRNQYISVRSSNRMMNGLIQSWLRTKAKGLEDYQRILELKGNTSNNTVFADSKGNVAYWHGNYVPKRNPSYNWGEAVDGTIDSTEWKGLHDVKEIVQIINPATGWIQNCNSTPYTVSGNSSPLKTNYPFYMAPDGENFRGVNAVRVLAKENAFTVDKLIAAGYDRKLPAFEILVPAMIRAYDRLTASGDTVYADLKEAIEILRTWNYESGDNTIAATLAIHWGEHLPMLTRNVYINNGEPDQVKATNIFADTASATHLLIPLKKAILFLKENNKGEWKIKWGEINRYQRISNSTTPDFRDDAPSYPVPFAASTWGQLPSYHSGYFSGTHKRYGMSGNSFICAVEFGKKVKARSLLAGGNSGDPSSPHFTDQLIPYTKGIFKEVLFYKEDVLKGAKRSYRPGEE
jgi:acyl-homoserine-lactone acylase